MMKISMCLQGILVTPDPPDWLQAWRHGRYLVENADHSTVCRPSSRDSNNYSILAHLLQRVMNKVKPMDIISGAAQESTASQMLLRAFKTHLLTENLTSLDPSACELLVLNLLHADMADIIQALRVDSYPNTSPLNSVNLGTFPNQLIQNLGPNCVLVGGRLKSSKQQLEFLF